ncbi:MAG: exodeoxyribonuclease VII large subunit [Verrucomicrobia bacterium]|nr:exodeoxyribonuclease VII large subunit [Verrucomicrobiota bacterium]
MPKQLKSPWDFGELFPAEATRRVLTVSELTTQVRRLLEQHIGQVWVTGELTNLRAQASGHIYFTLKDAAAQLACVLFRGEARETRHLLQDGQKVLLQGELTVYEPRGQYQLRVTTVELQGVGALQLAFERLKQKLAAEGLFAAEHKRPLPWFVQRIGLVTSPTGAAIRDVLHVVKRRHPGLEIILAPCRVQGEGAAEEIAAAIRLLNEFNISSARRDGSLIPHSALRTLHSALDLILVTRGGGSLEDLWAFNEEVVARAIFNSALPVVSAVGHEIDFTISDFVADVRAATPSAAAEILTEGFFSARPFIAEAVARLAQLARQRVAREREFWEGLTERLVRAHPRRRLNEKLQRLDDLQASLLRCARTRWRERFSAWELAAQRLRLFKPSQLLRQRRQALREVARRLPEQARRRWQAWQAHFATAAARLNLLSPASVLARGYSITTDARTGKVIRAADEVTRGQRLRTQLHSGQIQSVVET